VDDYGEAMTRIAMRLDRELLAEAASILGTKNPSDTVNAALKDAIAHCPKGNHSPDPWSDPSTPPSEDDGR
jgi:hypothetical protein